MEIDRLDIIATTISGSVSDWHKVSGLEKEFRKTYSGRLFIHVVNSHADALSRAAEIVELGGRAIVSAGGAGTFNSVLEGCCASGGVPEEMKLAFLRKGSADLIGKAMGIPDDLQAAVQAILGGFEEENFVDADIVEVTGDSTERRHLIGFGGVGVFGDTPRFTENRFIKYYKGYLGSLFGDLGPFLVGVNLALLKYHLDTLKGKAPRCEIVAGDIVLPMDRYISTIILNGDLGEDFPLAGGMPFASGDVKVVAIRDRGVAVSYRQLISCWKGMIPEGPSELGVTAFRSPALEIIPDWTGPYTVNVDGLILRTRGPVRFAVTDRVKLVSGRQKAGSAETGI